MIKLLLIIILSIFFNYSSYGQEQSTETVSTYFQKLEIGEMKKSEKKIILEEKEYPLYEYQDTIYMPISYLEKNKAAQDIEIENYGAIMNDHPVYIGNLKTYSLLVNQEVLVPIESLGILGKVIQEGNYYYLDTRVFDINRYIKIEEDRVINQSPYVLRISYKSIYWNDIDYEEIQEKDILLDKGEEIRLNFISPHNKKAIHLTTIIEKIYEMSNEINELNPYGQKNTSLFTTYENIMRLQELEKIFTPYIVTGTIKYPIGNFKIKDQVEVWRGEKRQYYVVIDQNNKKITVPWGSLEIIGDLGVKWPEATFEEIEDYANLKGLKSETDYFLWTDLYRQRTYVLKEKEGKWKVEKVMTCSTGRNTYLTPRGEFELEYRIPHFGMGKGFMCKNAVVIFRDYMYHSILFDKTGQYVKEGKYQLGQRVSHGCIRLSEEDSAWIYKNIPLGTKVWIN